MKHVRTYPPVVHDWHFEQKETYITDEEEYFCDLWENDRKGFYSELRYLLDAYDFLSRWDGDKYERFEFYLTSPGRITVVRIWGWDV